MKKFVVIIALALAAYFLKPYWQPHWNFYFSKPQYRYVYPNEPIVVGVEPDNMDIPVFVKKLLQLVFPGREIVFSNTEQPHIIIRSSLISRQDHDSLKYRRWDAPYFSLSGERYSLAFKRYRKNGPPLAELVSAAPKYTRQFYFPFITWCNVPPVRHYMNTQRNNFLAYTARNCVPKREKLFAAIKSINSRAMALGSCSNSNAENTLAGDWTDLNKTYKDYQFVFALENKKVPGYVTEKILTAYYSGAIPIYYGDTTNYIGKHLNPKAFIDVDKFSSLQELAMYINDLSKEPEKINAMRNEPIFKDNIVPELFYIENTNRTDIPELIQAAEYIKQEFDKLNLYKD